MRVECESCRALVVASFTIRGAAIRAACPVCRHEMVVSPTVEPAGTSSASSSPAVSGGAASADPVRARCPKCGTPRGDGTACASCGLTVARMAAFTAARDAAVPDAVAAAWRGVTEAWSDPARHDELLRVVAAHDRYAWAASQYRARNDDEIARRQLDRLRRAAEATLLAGATVRPEVASAPYRATRAVLILLIAAVVVGLIYAMVIRTRAPGPRAPVIPARPLEPGRPVSPSTIR